MSLASGPGRGGASATKLCPELILAAEKHITYIQGLDSRRDDLDYWLTEHLRLNGIYWGLTAVHLLGRPDALPRDKTVDFVVSCYHENGGFGAAPGHDAHMLSTVSAVQILAMIQGFVDFEKRIPAGRKQIARFIAGLQTLEGTFAGDEWGETDTRFLYGALNALSLLDRLDAVDMNRAVRYIQTCQNFDGGYGTMPGAESHAGQIFTCVSALGIAGRLDLVNRDRLGEWLSERQLENGGLNGRPSKDEDVCYSWWVLSSLATIERLHWIDGIRLRDFILSCQDPEQGGISDRPGNMVDVFHTVFGIAGLSLLTYANKTAHQNRPDFDCLGEVDPLFCLPKATTEAVFKSRTRTSGAGRDQL